MNDHLFKCSPSWHLHRLIASVQKQTATVIRKVFAQVHLVHNCILSWIRGPSKQSPYSLTSTMCFGLLKTTWKLQLLDVIDLQRLIWQTVWLFDGPPVYYVSAWLISANLVCMLWVDPLIKWFDPLIKWCYLWRPGSVPSLLQYLLSGIRFPEIWVASTQWNSKGT